MTFLCRDVAPHILRQATDVHCLPPIYPGQRPQAQSFYAIAKSDAVPTADLVLYWVFGPGIEWCLEDLLLNVGEPCRLQHLPGVCMVLYRSVNAAGGIYEVLVPLHDWLYW